MEMEVMHRILNAILKFFRRSKKPVVTKVKPYPEFVQAKKQLGEARTHVENMDKTLQRIAVMERARRLARGIKPPSKVHDVGRLMQGKGKHQHKGYRRSVKEKVQPD